MPKFYQETKENLGVYQTLAFQCYVSKQWCRRAIEENIFVYGSIFTIYPILLRLRSIKHENLLNILKNIAKNK